MEKQKRWQFWLIIAVLALTLYNILPTVFYYAQPLKDPIGEKKAEQIGVEIINRVDALESDAIAWIESYSKLLNVKPTSIQLKESNPGTITIKFNNNAEADLFRRMLPTAGAWIPFMPAQLGIFDEGSRPSDTTVEVTRRINIHLDPSEVNSLFKFSPKYDEEGKISPLYRDITLDRVTQIAKGFGGSSREADQLTALAQYPNNRELDDLVLTLMRQIVDIDRTFGNSSSITKRYYASFTQTANPLKDSLIQKFKGSATALKGRLEADFKTLEAQTGSLETSEIQQKNMLKGQITTLEKGIEILTQNKEIFNQGQAPLEKSTIENDLVEGFKQLDVKDPVQTLSFDGHNPFVEGIVLDWGNDRIDLTFYPDVQSIREEVPSSEGQSYVQNKLNQFVINEIAFVSRVTDESIIPSKDTFSLALSNLTNMQSFLSFDLGSLANKKVDHLAKQLQTSWKPQSPDLVAQNYPVIDYTTFTKLSPEEQRLGLVVYAPSNFKETPPQGFKPDSIYIIARGMDAILQKAREGADGPGQKQMANDLNHLTQILQNHGFVGYPGSSYGVDTAFKNDYIFRLEDYYGPLLKATREDFVVKGSKRDAVLNFTDLEQRIITRNKIDDRIQEDLVKWQESYDSAQVSLDPQQKFLVPAPTQSPFWQNTKLTAAKYFRGDDRKILKWGLDLSGGKTVRIGLRDHEGRTVTNPEDLNQAVNELYTRINNMGVAERTIKIENENIILDFPGSQALSASELVKASAMSFHIANEKFSSLNPGLNEAVNSFLQQVWNEAVVTNRKDPASINQIAWEHLGGDLAESEEIRPRSENAQVLYENGLRILNSDDQQISNNFDDTLSSVAILRGDSPKEWGGQSHPLLFVFANYALEGANLTDIQAGYDPSKGNILSFTVKSSFDGRAGNPRDELYAWTSQFAEDQIQGTPKETFSNGRGWRMAIILNDRVISMPALNFPIRNQAQIEGRFSQREVNQLAADLKAGSLSFTPRILSEQNVSPELGREERMKGISASLIALALVFITMVSYYRFAGLVASCAVVLNIFIMWGVLQNLGAAITLPGIAGIVLTIGMAVDANVLVFERFREEFKISGRLGSAIQTGYRKAFSAIVDSNITTIIAALILLQFDSGPIKGFAVTLIIGIISSMFTALFMTRYFFAGWVRNPKNTKLNMAELVGDTHFDFLGWSRFAIIASFVVMAIGGYLFVKERNTLFGMDFTGGYSLTLELNEVPGTYSYRLQAVDALQAQGAPSTAIQVQELSKPNQLRIQLGIGMEEPAYPFYQMPELLPEGKYTYNFQTVPRIVWVVDALEKGGLSVQESDLLNLDKAWTSMSGQFSETMRNNAIKALGLALLSVLIYITLRFEFKYAVAAVIALAHDVLITVGIIAFFRWIGMPVQINLEVIGAIMTIIGYSLNDTIIVFDRIREDLKIFRKLSYREVINRSINVTLSRTLMTSGTTLVVLLTLVVLGGSTIFDFSLVMSVGVIIGTLSSLFVAGPVLLFFHNRELEQESQKHAHASLR